MSIPRVPIKTGYIPMIGGLDTETPPIAVDAGKCSESVNVYQHVNGGYKTIEGYEPFDGQASPDDALYYVLDMGISTTARVGDTVTDGTETALVILVSNPSDMGTTENAYIVLTMQSGYFTPGDLYVGVDQVGTFTAPQVESGASTPELDAKFRELAADAYRTAIQSPPGSGATLGGKYFNGTLYVFRNAADGLSANLWKSTSAGWVQVPLGRELSFSSGGIVVPTIGQTITGATSGSTAVLTRVVLESGDWAAGDAAGRFIFASQTGTFVSENINIGASLDVATIGGNSSAITLAPSGSYQIIKANFTGSTLTERLYGCDGVNRGFEFDGTVFVPIRTGMGSDSPSCVVEFANHLIFSFGGSIQNSAIGDPYNWTPYLGASEIAVGDTVTGFSVQAGSESAPSLAIFSKNRVHTLYGTSRDDWQLIPLKRDDSGAIRRSIRNIGQTFMLDTRGITTLGATDVFGNFAMSNMSATIKTWLAPKVSMFTDSCVMRNKNLYCIFFSDGYGLYSTITVNGNGSASIGAMMPVLLPDPLKWVDSTEAQDGDEVVFFGGASGAVYKWGSGTSFSGDPINWNITTHYANFKSGAVSATMLKKFRLATVEMSGSGYAEFSFSYSLGYGDSYAAQPSALQAQVDFSMTVFDEDYFDECFFDGVALSPSRFDICGNAANISFSFYGSNNFSAPVIINGINILYSLTKEAR